MIYINVTSFVLISQPKKDHSMIETHRLKILLFFSKHIELFETENNNFRLFVSYFFVKG